MKQITLHVYQSIDSCLVRPDKYFDAAVDVSGFVLIDEETYLRIYLNHLGWPLMVKETLVVTDNCTGLTEKERVRFVTGDTAAGLRGIKADGKGTITAYGAKTGALLSDNGLAGEAVVITVPVLIGDGEKTLECGLNNGGMWIVRSNKVLEDGKVRTMYGKVCPQNAKSHWRVAWVIQERMTGYKKTTRQFGYCQEAWQVLLAQR